MAKFTSLFTTQVWTEKKGNEISFNGIIIYYFMTKRIITSDFHVIINFQENARDQRRKMPDK